MNQSKLYKWIKFTYQLFKFGIVMFLILMSLILGVMLVDDLNFASITIIVLVAALMIFLFRKIH